ncbi:MAG TPA: glutamine--fructose-6-phosphate transaminase (isomerizing) [Terriglobales bacterium]|nr:glutamine--fructose-6-phosphate transaminase (isomerizing) [Terriglobales bacterium]
MCGIAGIASFQPIADRLYEGVHHLEYRGYDSCGVAFLNHDHIEIRKHVGTVDEVDSKESIRGIDSYVGIAHTRWATHGRVTRENAHPHDSCGSEFVVVHNGIIANYKDLKEQLIRAGHRFDSDTDTEVIAHLIEHHYKEHGQVERAWISALRDLEGSYALAMISIHERERIFCARHESPLIIGLGSNSNYIGSDFNAFIDYTKNTVILDDGEYGIVSKDSYAIKSLRTGEPIDKPITVIPWDPEVAGKGGYPHYMLKEIHEQPQCIRSALRIGGDEIAAVAELMAESRRVHLIGVGTTYYVALYGQYAFSTFADIEVPAVSSDEFRHLDKSNAEDLVIAVSQSGETYDTVMSLRNAKERGAKTAAIVNVIGSSISRLADRTILQGSGPEVCVVSTKAALVQMLILTRLAIELGERRGVLTAARRLELEEALVSLPERIEAILNEQSGVIRAAAYRHAQTENWLFLGRGIYYPIALESSLKMKEVTYVHAEGMPGGFLKHGTLSLIDDRFNTLVAVPPKSIGDLYSATMSSLEEVKARGGFIFGLTFNDDHPELFDERVVLQEAPHVIAPLLPLVCSQLLAYFTATALKRNVDKPRSLAKSVTVA